MAREMIEVLDSGGKETGEVKPRDEVHRKELFHPAVVVWIYNRKGELLLQKRSENKKQLAGVWGASAAGHIVAGNEPVEEALRELEEELGIKADRNDLEYIGVYRAEIPIPETGKFDNEYVHTFLLEFKGKVSDFELNEEEVDEVRFFPMDELLSDFNSDSPSRKYTPYGEYLEKVIASVKENSQDL